MSPFSHCFLLCGTATTSASIPVGSPSSPPPCSSLAELSTIRVIVYVYYSRLYTDIEVVTSYSRRHSDHQLYRPICRVAYMTEWSCCMAARHDSECEPPVASLRFPRTASRFFMCLCALCSRSVARNLPACPVRKDSKVCHLGPAGRRLSRFPLCPLGHECQRYDFLSFLLRPPPMTLIQIIIWVCLWSLLFLLGETGCDRQTYTAVLYV